MHKLNIFQSYLQCPGLDKATTDIQEPEILCATCLCSLHVAQATVDLAPFQGLQHIATY